VCQLYPSSHNATISISNCLLCFPPLKSPSSQILRRLLELMPGLQLAIKPSLPLFSTPCNTPDSTRAMLRAEVVLKHAIVKAVTYESTEAELEVLGRCYRGAS
jgi:hypothetical protein